MGKKRVRKVKKTKGKNKKKEEGRLGEIKQAEFKI